MCTICILSVGRGKGTQVLIIKWNHIHNVYGSIMLLLSLSQLYFLKRTFQPFNLKYTNNVFKPGPFGVNFSILDLIIVSTSLGFIKLGVPPPKKRLLGCSTPAPDRTASHSRRRQLTIRSLSTESETYLLKLQYVHFRRQYGQWMYTAAVDSLPLNQCSNCPLLILGCLKFLRFSVIKLEDLSIVLWLSELLHCLVSINSLVP